MGLRSKGSLDIRQGLMCFTILSCASIQPLLLSFSRTWCPFISYLRKDTLYLSTVPPICSAILPIYRTR
ncbi:hypothetical protein BDW68DRAFT_154009 [Aspergillus falconensis]